ncbi:hypothetical protein GQ53DRAFT_752269 [Thozetella sp. PMI_491]|nr:hypothetical protein GQ53DRAFT_752269 [Thozetella sp. PMI_491]
MEHSGNYWVSISCHCGASKQDLSLPNGPASWESVSICHCNTCRHHTGLLCTSYLPIVEPSRESLRELIEYTSSKSSRWFCKTCGCHIFRSSAGAWSVATGVIARSPSSVPPPENDGRVDVTWAHRFEGDTKDGGLSNWLRGNPIETTSVPKDVLARQVGTTLEPALSASCHCSNVHFTITRPDVSSSLPRSNFSDLILPYCSTPSELVSNPANEKWWLCDGRTKYLAGTCVCRSCRLISGFEIQTWTFVPRSNILFQDSSSPGSGQEGQTIPLDFTSIPSGILQSYESSPGVIREFCPKCGATVFWHDKWRPDLIDVSVGLLQANGARAEDWLSWCLDRVSFAEDVVNDRQGDAAVWAGKLVDALGRGLQIN